LDPSLPPVVTEKNSLKQIFINLIQNASEAMPHGGNLYISTRYDSKYLEAKLEQGKRSDLGNVEIIIRDDGPGIPDSLKSQLFEPFITSKGEAHAGLGLSIVYNLVKGLKGTITCRSDTKNGTSFTIVFPLVQNQES
jgi:signal transduction histidine kinase